MENIELEIPMQLLAAAAICAAVNDVRFYLCGIAIDKGHIVSTDGHRGFACEIEGVSADLPQIIIPTESVNFFLKKLPAKNRKANCRLIFNPRTREGELRFDALIVKESFVGHDAKYPDRQRIFPRAVEPEYKGIYPQFNWAYMYDFQKVQKALGGKGLLTLLHPTGANSAALVTFDNTNFDHAKGVIMPLRA
ncbi:hypothetical protein ABEF79_05895 [Acinetobacter sp. ANC 7454]|uniref:hypothetical protein n=1 Tax=Acinetobacter thermotolerans TaxID=3151487 RepID=UPI00325AFD30